LVGDARARLREASPFSLLAMASGLIEATTPRPVDSWGGGAKTERPDGAATFDSFALSGSPPMEALALAVATLHSDGALAARLTSMVDPSAVHGGPHWLAKMGTIEIAGTQVYGDVLGDGENVVISWEWPDGQAATMVVYVDHNVGTIVKDAFAVPETAAALVAALARHGAEHVLVESIDPADARARITEAIEIGERMVPPFETDTWPTCRPMVEWLLRRLPTGGAGYVRPDWPEESRERLLDEFVDSSFGAVDGLTRAQVRELADPLIGFGCDYGPGDPLRWSPVSVEIVLADWYPRKVFGVPAAELRRLPDVLEGFVGFSHDRKNVAAELTDETLDAIERWSEAFRFAIDRPGRSPAANAVRLARIAAGFDPNEFDDEADDFDDDDDDDDDDDLDPEHQLDDEAYMTQVVDNVESMMIELVGGRAAYDALDDAPLADVAFDSTRVPADVVDAVAETLVHLDRWALELFDPEVRTIARRVLGAVVETDPAMFKRSPRMDALAAATLSYLLDRLIGRFSAEERRQLPWKVSTQKALAQATGVSASSISNRAKTTAKVVERADIDWPSVLHSTQRQEALRTRQLVSDWRRDHP
jgi:hypothetical protein